MSQKKPVSSINSVNPLYLVIKSVQRYLKKEKMMTDI